MNITEADMKALEMAGQKMLDKLNVLLFITPTTGSRVRG
jgi:hypothetical protein